VALLFTFYQCFQARDLPIEYSEASSLAISMGCLLETLLVGAPLLFVSAENPSSQFIIRTLLVCIACLAILLPVFVQKYVQRNLNKQARNVRSVTTDVSTSGQFQSSSFSPVSGRSTFQNRQMILPMRMATSIRVHWDRAESRDRATILLCWPSDLQQQQRCISQVPPVSRSSRDSIDGSGPRSSAELAVGPCE
jgi:hypothetical protein